ncbi:MAG: TauD/TfdA family dioxygenase [Pseudomonadota bacterium]
MTRSDATSATDQAAAFEVEPLSVHIGAEIHGLDIAQPLKPETVAALRDALLRWKVIFFRDQILDHERHIRFARHFGQPTPGHVVFGGDELYPEIYAVAKHRVALAANETLQRSWSEWHTDITAAVNPPAASILRGAVVPPYGGDTHWTNLAAAYQALSPTLRGFLETLRARHAFKAPQDNDDAAAYQEKTRTNDLVAEHPLVTVHPETGEPVLYISPIFVQSIVGLAPRESQCLLEMLWEHAVRSEFTVRFRWRPGSVAFWDNRATAHLAPSDIFATDFDRQFYRVTLMGEVPRGADGSPSTLISGQPIEAL